MIIILRQMGVWIGTGPLAPLANILAIATTVVALLIVVMELSGRTISRRGIVRSSFHWDLTAFVVMIATAALVVAVDPVRFDFIHILKNGPRLAPSLAPVIAVVFGLPGVFGYMLGVLVTNLMGGGLTALAVFTGVWSALSWVWITWLPYKAVGKLDFSKVGAGAETLGRFYLWSILIGPFLHLWSSPGLQVLQGGAPADVWGRMLPMITINHDLPLLIVGPIALAILYPAARLSRLYWRDREQAVPAVV